MEVPAQSLIERDIVLLQSLAQHLVERHAGARVSYRRIHLGYLRGNERPLIDDDVVERRYSVGKLLALAGEELLLQDPGLPGRRVFGARLAEGAELVGDIHHDLVHVSLAADLRLAELQLVDPIVALRLPVSHRNRKTQLALLTGKIPAKYLFERRAITPDEIRIRRILGRPRRAAVIGLQLNLQARQKRVLSSGQRDLGGLVAELRDRYVGPLLHGRADQLAQRGQIVGVRHLDAVERHDFGSLYLGIRRAG